MSRQNTQIESIGAEFLVLGNLMIRGILANKSYHNTPGYDLIAVNPDQKKIIRIQVKSRWRTDAPGFLINNFDSDFVIAVRLNRGGKNSDIRDPEYFVFPTDLIEKAPRSAEWGKVNFKNIPDFVKYKNNWEQIGEALSLDSAIDGADTGRVVNASEMIYNKPQVIKSIINSIAEKAKTKEEILSDLIGLFPERSPKDMKSTINTQLSGKELLRIEKERNIQVNISIGDDDEKRYSLVQKANI